MIFTAVVWGTSFYVVPMGDRDLPFEEILRKKRKEEAKRDGSPTETHLAYGQTPTKNKKCHQVPLGVTGACAPFWNG